MKKIANNPLIVLPAGQRFQNYGKRSTEFEDYNDYYRLFKKLLDATEHPE